MAEAHLVAMSPHNYNSTMIGLAATVHAAAVMPNFLITEYFTNFEELGKKIAHPPMLQEGGFVPLPKTPGLGMDLDEEALRAHAYAHFPKRNIRQYSDEP
jgi:galactonate dehydratase